MPCSYRSTAPGRGVHADAGRAAHDFLDLGDLAAEDQILDQRRMSMISMAAMRPRPTRADQPLRNQRADIERHVHQQLLAALLTEEIDDAVECLVRAVGMQRGQHQVAGFGELNAVFHRLAITDLADQDHVGRLAQRVLERRVPGVGIQADFALGDDAAAVRMHVLDRILDRDDVPRVFSLR